jgi:hypothetical protein
MGQSQRTSISEVEQTTRADEIRVEIPDESVEKPPKGRKNRRRSSIPDLMNEAKKLVLGNRMLKATAASTDRPTPSIERGTEKQKSLRRGERGTSGKPRIERRSTLKQLKLPDVEEIGEILEENVLSPDRRHSLEAGALSRSDTRSQSIRCPESRLFTPMTGSSFSNLVSEIMHPNPKPQQASIAEIQSWWDSINSPT